MYTGLENSTCPLATANTLGHRIRENASFSLDNLSKSHTSRPRWLSWMRLPTGDPRQGRQHSFLEIDHEIFSTVILSLPLIQEGQLSVSGERMCTILVNRLED